MGEAVKIAFFISSLQKGGSERVMTNLIACFVGEGYDGVLVTQHKAETEYPLPAGIRRVLSEITEEERTSSRIGNFRRRFRKLQAIWRQERPDVILSFIGKNNCMALLTARALHIPVVVAVRGEPAEEYKSRLLKTAANLLFPRAAAVVLQTRASMDFFSPRVRKRAVILQNSLHPDFIRPVTEEHMPSGEREKRIVAVGRLDENKNHRMLVEAFAPLAKEFPEYRVVIYGEGDSREALERRIGELGLDSRIRLPGVISRVADAIADAEIFVLTSYSEGMPNTLMEAMALGLACIATDCPCGGPAELIESGENGLLIPSGDTAALTEALRELMQSPDRAVRLGEKAARIQQSCHPDRVNRDWQKLLDGCINV